MPADPCSGVDVVAKFHRLCAAETGAPTAEAIVATGHRSISDGGTPGDLSAALRHAILLRA